MALFILTTDMFKIASYQKEQTPSFVFKQFLAEWLQGKYKTFKLPEKAPQNAPHDDHPMEETKIIDKEDHLQHDSAEDTQS